MRAYGNGTGRCQRRLLLTSIASAVALIGSAGHALAMSIDSGNEDVQMRLDTKLSFTAGWRAEGRDDAIAANPQKGSAVSSEYFADKGDLYTTRLDLFSEFDFRYMKDHGLRISGAAWTDPKFPGAPRTPFGAANSAFGPAGQWPAEIKRYYGSSAEFLDAFAFTRFDLASVPVNMKIGRTSVVWGESVFGGVGGANSVGYAQNPDDGRKSSQNPNASLKETSLPLGQVHAVFNVSDTSNLSVYRAFEFRASRVPGSGTYLGFSDGVGGAPNLFCSQLLPYGCFPYGPPVKGGNNDWGIQYKARPSYLDATVGVVYREFSEKSPWYAAWNVADNFPIGNARSLYGKDEKLLGVTLNTTKWNVSWGGEVSYRKNAALVSDFSALAPVAVGGLNGPGGLFSSSPTEGARGDTLHALVNGQMVLGKAAFWDTLTIAAEAAVSHLQKVTRNSSLLQAEGASYAPVLCNAPAAFGGAPNRKVAGCVDKTASSFAIYVSPTIYQAMPSIDLEIPIFFQANFGNSPVANGSTDGFNTLSAGVKATWSTAWGPQVFQLNYLKFNNRKDANNPAGRAILGGPYYDRSQVQLTYTTSF